MKLILIGILMGVIFLALDAAIPAYVPYETRIFVFAICLLVVCSAVIDGAKSGLICGLMAFAVQDTGTFVRYAMTFSVDIAVALLPYSIVLTLTYLIAGVLGGYLGGKLGASGCLQARSRPV